jgi:glutamate-5-semialdehyde dehydrogenase
METLLIHKDIAPRFIPVGLKALADRGVELRGDETVRALFPSAKPAAEEDWEAEFYDLILAVKVVDSLEAAMDHIYRYGTQHSEAIVTESYTNAQAFLSGIDAAAVYVNASTRFTDGGVYGFGAEMGISTQKLHARGPMGVEQLTSTKFIVYGNGQTRG